MFKLKNNRFLVGAFAILMVIGMAAAYVPLLIPQAPQSQAPAPQYAQANIATSTSSDSVTATPTSTPTSSEATSPSTATISTSSAPQLPASLTGLQEEQQQTASSVDSILNQPQ